MPIEIRLLGGVEAALDGTPVDLRGARQRRLLACLSLLPGRVRNIDVLASAVWPAGDIPVDPRATLQTYVSRLRSSLGGPDTVVGRDGGYALGVDADAVDAHRFERLVTAAGAASGDERTERLRAALALWNGPALAGFEDEEWARAAAVRLEELRANAVDDLAEALISSGRAAAAVADLEAAAVTQPLRDRTHRLLMDALHRCGRQAEALRVYQDFRRRLATDLGLDPSEAMRALEAQVAAGPLVAAGGVVSLADQPVRGYQLGERLGDGAFAVVYRGTQPSVGREVAVKVIRAELANRPEFVRRFEAEAHLVARLEHPHVVPLYDYWREPGAAYLVMRLLRGGTLERAVAERPLALDEAHKMVGQVGAALAVAHRAGVVHRDVKPANIFLDGDGNFFLGDFGIAYEIAAPYQPTDSLSIGSPAYASPEQLRREPAGPPADVHGLGIALYEALTGQLPFPDATSQAELLARQLNDPIPSVRAHRPDVPAAFDAILARATAKLPTDRYPDIESFVADCDEAFGGISAGGPTARTGVATVMGEFRNPYKGLRAFQEADAADFCGRARLGQKILDRLSGNLPAHRFVAVIGPSGSGKSSVVRAGVLPALRRGTSGGSANWFVTSMVPGTHPFEELAAALQRISSVPITVETEGAGSGRGIARSVKRALPGEADELLLLIDQFEELFTLCTDDAMRQRFIAELVEAVSDPRSRLRVLVTLRADFYDRPLRYPELAPLIEQSAVTVSPLAPDELELAIVEPAARVGSAFEPGLVARIVADVVDQPGALPLLQYALTELFERQVSGLLTVNAYQDLGGLTGALARRAEQLHAEGSPAEQAAARRLFTRLVTLGDGTEDTRRRVRRSELGADPAVDAVIERFGAARLLSFDRDPGSREPTVEVAHEALIREWRRLRAWLDDDRDGLRIRHHLTHAAAAWQLSNRDRGELYRGGRLEAAEHWAGANATELNEAESAFLAASIAQRRAERAAERRSHRRIRIALVTVAAVAVLALVAGGLAFQQRGTARAAAAEAGRQTGLARGALAEAETRRLVADAAALVSENRDVALLLASEAYRRDPGPHTLAGLQRVLTSTGPYLGTIGAGQDFLEVDVLDDGTIVGLTKTDLRFYDPHTWALTRTVPLPAPPTDIAGIVPFDVRGGTVVVGNDAGSVLVVEGGSSRVLPLGSVAVRSLALGDGAIAAGTVDGQLHLLDAATGAARWSTLVVPERSYREVMGDERWNALPAGLAGVIVSLEGIAFRSGPASLLFEPSGTILSGGVRIRRLDAASGRILEEATPTNPVTGLPLLAARLTPRPGGGYLSAGANNVFAVDESLRAVVVGAVPTGRTDANVVVRSLAFDAAGEPVYGLTNGQLARGIARSQLEGSNNPATGLGTVRGLRYRPDGTLLVAGEGGIVVWGDDGRQLLARAVPRDGHSGGTINPDGSELVVSTLDGPTAGSRFDIRNTPAKRLPTPSVPPRFQPRCDTGPVESIRRELQQGRIQALRPHLVAAGGPHC